MNNELLLYVRKRIKELLTQCTEDQQMFFKRMYSHTDLILDINTVVDNMPEEKLDWALSQCQHQTILNTKAALAKAEVNK